MGKNFKGSYPSKERRYKTLACRYGYNVTKEQQASIILKNHPIMFIYRNVL